MLASLNLAASRLAGDIQDADSSAYQPENDSENDSESDSEHDSENDLKWMSPCAGGRDAQARSVRDERYGTRETRGHGPRLTHTRRSLLTASRLCVQNSPSVNMCLDPAAPSTPSTACTHSPKISNACTHTAPIRASRLRGNRPAATRPSQGVAAALRGPPGASI